MDYYKVTFVVEAENEDDVEQWASKRAREIKLGLDGVELKRYDVKETLTIDPPRTSGAALAEAARTAMANVEEETRRKDAEE